MQHPRITSSLRAFINCPAIITYGPTPEFGSCPRVVCTWSSLSVEAEEAAVVERRRLSVVPPTRWAVPAGPRVP
jgi:hypothetical protein